MCRHKINKSGGKQTRKDKNPHRMTMKMDKTNLGNIAQALLSGGQRVAFVVGRIDFAARDALAIARPRGRVHVWAGCWIRVSRSTGDALSLCILAFGTMTS